MWETQKTTFGRWNNISNIQNKNGKSGHKDGEKQEKEKEKRIALKSKQKHR